MAGGDFKSFANIKKTDEKPDGLQEKYLGEGKTESHESETD
jgi:hypothetical protein